MEENTRNTANELITAMEDRQIQEEVVSSIVTDPTTELRQEVLKFFTDRFNRIRKVERFKERVQETLEGMVDRDELNFDQLVTLYNMASKQAGGAAQGVLDIFRPVPNAPSILAPEISEKKHEDDYEKAFDAMKPEDLQALNVLFRAIEKSRKTDNKKSEVEDE